MISVGGLLLGLINIAIVVVALILIGLLVEWFCKTVMGLSLGPELRKFYLILVGLIGLYMLVALLLGLPTVRLIGSAPHQRSSSTNLHASQVQPLPSVPAGPPPICSPC